LPQIDLNFNNAIGNITSQKVLSLLSYRMMLHDLTEDQPFTILSDKEKEDVEYKKVDQNVAKKILQNKLDSIQVLTPAIPEERDLLKFIELYGYDLTSIYENLNVSRYQRTDYINITYVSENPKLSAF